MDDVDDVKEEDMWKLGQSRKGDAIIAVDEAGHGHMVIMLTANKRKIELNGMDNYSFTKKEYDAQPGLYYANIYAYWLIESVMVDWEIVSPLLQIEMKQKKA